MAWPVCCKCRSLDLPRPGVCSSEGLMPIASSHDQGLGSVACPSSVSLGTHLQCQAGILRASSLCTESALSSVIPQAGLCPSARDSLGLCHVVVPQGLAGSDPEPVQHFVPKSNGRHSSAPFSLLRTPPPLAFQGS